MGLHHHGNNIPVFHTSFPQLNIYVKLHSYDFFSNKNMWTLFNGHMNYYIVKSSFSCPFIYTSSLFQVPTQFCTSHSIIYLKICPIHWRIQLNTIFIPTCKVVKDMPPYRCAASTRSSKGIGKIWRIQCECKNIGPYHMTFNTPETKQNNIDSQLTLISNMRLCFRSDFMQVNVQTICSTSFKYL